MQFEDYLKRRGIPFTKDTHPTTYTAQRLADVEHVSGYMVAKPVIVKSSFGFAMCVLPAPKHVDLHRLADLFHDEGLRLATEAELAKLFPDCELGAEPPVGTLYGLTTIMDKDLRHDEFLVMQAGSHSEAIKIRCEDWERMCHPMVAAIAGA